MKKTNIILLLLLCQAFIFCIKKDNENTKYSDKILQEQRIILDDMFFDEIKREGKWIKSWDSINENNFYLLDTFYVKKEWMNIGPSLKKDSLLLKNYSKDLALDLYSNNIDIEKVKSKTQVNFSVDTQINIIDFKSNKYKEFILLGSFEKIDDGFWFNEKTVVLLGFEEYDEKSVPIILMVDVVESTIIYYKYFKGFKSKRENYFFKKYPNSFLGVDND